uniref:Enkurin domain-containing protein n=1 Tax=Amphiprion percula TaxID=161767 RepID=A0A3P8RM03_AMPPE
FSDSDSETLKLWTLLIREAWRISKYSNSTLHSFRPTVVQESKLTKDAMRTMGPAKVELPSPDKYLKKPSKESRPLEGEFIYLMLIKPTPALRRNHQFLQGLTTNSFTLRDFIKTATAVPKKPQPMWVDTNTGHKQPLENSGLVPKYIKKKDYGKVPAYLQQRNEEKLRAEEEYSKFVQEQREQRAPRRLPDEERRGVLITLLFTLNFRKRMKSKETERKHLANLQT